MDETGVMEEYDVKWDMLINKNPNNKRKMGFYSLARQIYYLSSHIFVA